MKSLLRFFLLFALIVIGKVAKEPMSFLNASKAMQSAPVSPVSLLQQPNTQADSPAGDFELWQPTASSAKAVTSFQ